MRDVVGSNPNIFLLSMASVRATMAFLQHTMHVSARRVAVTPESLQRSLAFYQRRYQVLLVALVTPPSPVPPAVRPLQAPRPRGQGQGRQTTLENTARWHF